VVVVRRTPGSRAFADTDLARLSLFAGNAALAVHLAEGQRHRELQVLAERDRISTELYDHVWQQLFGIGTAMQITRRRMPSLDSEARTGDHIDQLQGVVRQLRQAIFDGQPGPAVPPQLRTSLMQMITLLTAGSPLHTSVHMSGTLDDLPPDLAQHATEVLREAVGNAVRHSHAEELGITISVTDDLVVVQVTDNGVGTTDTTPGAGLRDLQRRATDVAGSLIVSGARGAGTHLTWTAPVP
jgi:signal transduction histidine kinase